MADKDQSSTSQFMGLPTEVREVILRHLLIVRYTAREYTVNSAEYDGWRKYIQEGSDQENYFFPEIMSVCRRVYEESVDLCRRENDFICLTSSRPSGLGSFLVSPEDHKGLRTVARCSTARKFWNIAMTITLDPDGFADKRCWHNFHRDIPENEPPCKFIFCSDELPRFCRLLTEGPDDSWSGRSPMPLINAAIHIDVDNGVWNEHTKEMDRCAAGLSKLSRILEPLRQLHSFGAAQIEGPLSSSYKSDLNSSLCRVCPSAIEDFQSATASLTQGDEQDRQGSPDDALHIYKEALNLVRSCPWLYGERMFILESGPFPGLTAEQAMFNLKIRLMARIAAVYLKAGQFRMARVYTERAVDPQRGSERGWKTYDLILKDWQKPVFAEVLHVSAKISYRHGAVYTAVDNLSEAGRFVPLDEEQKCRLEAWTKILVDKSDRRERNMELQMRRKERKLKEEFQIVCNRKNRGDRLLETGRTMLAASTYRDALSKVELLYKTSPWLLLQHGPFEGYALKDGAMALWFKLQASLAASHLRSRRYRDILECTDAAFAWYDSLTMVCQRLCKHLYAYGREHADNHLCDDGCKSYLYKFSLSVTQQIEMARTYYCRAIAHKHLGHLADAVDYMEEALNFDPGDEQAFKQLELLKQKQEEVNAYKIQQRKEQKIQRAKRKKVKERLARGRQVHAGADRFYYGFHSKFWVIDDSSDSDSSSD